MTASLRVCSLVAFTVVAGCEPIKEAGFSVRESVEQLHVTHAAAGATLEVHDNKGLLVASGTADALGSFVFRNLPAGNDYVVRLAGSKPVEQSHKLKVMSVASSKPDPASYAQQQLVPGFNYLKMRDGTTLSAWVTLPGPAKGRYPTVVNYSGYSASKPGVANPDYDFLCADLPIVCTPPDDSTALLAGMFGYATVSVNMRGTGCSGGAYDYFEPLQRLDGYDVIEIVAAQSWALNHKVGMVGLSYPGISQLFVAAEHPPSLAAIAPMSVIGNTASTLLPGGILNDGFALSWVTHVVNKAVPYGQGWEQKRVDEGDEECRENQLLHGQLVDNVAQARKIEFYDPALHDQFNPTVFADTIDVPVFLTGQWQDEQTGPYFFTLFDKLSKAPAFRMTALNGVHIDAVAPEVLIEWQTFLELFVAHRVPLDPAKVRNFSTFIFDTAYHSKMLLPDSRFTRYATYDEAVAAWKAESKLRVIFESGAGDPKDLGAPKGTFEHSFDRFPPVTQPLRLYFQAGGRLAAQPPLEAQSASTFRLDPEAGARGILKEGSIWSKLPAYDWQQPRPGDAVVFEGEPLTADLTLVGTASVDLWLRSPVDDADLQVTLSEVRPDNKEMYVQSGWLRASHRAPGPEATALWPAQTFEQKNWAPLPIDEWTKVRVPTAGFAHVLRAGSRLRLAIDTPGGTRSEWRFALKSFPGEVRYAIGHDAMRASSLVLPQVDGLTVPQMLPACPSLRGQPCRTWAAYTDVPR
jgi:predicted acyl esterase